MHSILAIFEALKLMETYLYIQKILYLWRPNVHYLVARLLEAEEM